VKREGEKREGRRVKNWEKNMTLTEEVMQAALGASDELKAAALKVLRGVAAPGGGGGEDEGPLLLGMGAAAKRLGVSRATFWRMLQTGRIQKVELFTGSYRVRREDLTKLASGAFGDSGVKSRRGRPRKLRAGEP
jgi:excisionase family DNA binding protein